MGSKICYTLDYTVEESVSEDDGVEVTTVTVTFADLYGRKYTTTESLRTDLLVDDYVERHGAIGDAIFDTLSVHFTLNNLEA